MHRRSPLLIAFKGHPGAGKSVVARALGRRLSIAVLDKDDIKDVLDGICEDAGGLAYSVMFNLARRQVLQGLSVICDSPLSEMGGYAAARDVARNTRARLTIIECVCSSPEEWRRRIETRGMLWLPAHHVTSWDDLNAHLRRRAATSNYPIDDPHLVVDTVTPLEGLVEQIVTWLGSLA